MLNLQARWAALMAIVLSVCPGAQAAESYDNCVGFVDSIPATITTQGVWCLRADLSTTIDSGSAISIATNNVTLDCNGFKLGGLGAGPATTAFGVLALGRLNATIRNCNIRGFNRGIVLTGAGGGHLVQSNRLDGNTRLAIEIAGSGWTVRDNYIVDTGGAAAPGGTVGVLASGTDIDILNNSISGFSSIHANASASGITADMTNGGSIRGNRIRGIFAQGTSLARGIIITSNAGLAVRDNDIRGDGSVGSWGIACGTASTTARSNIISGFAVGINGCATSDNTINTN